MPDKFIDFTIRDFGIEDYDTVIELWRLAELEHRPLGRDTKERIAKEVKEDTAIFLVAESKGKMIGTLFCTHDGRKGWMNRLATHPDYLKLGVASSLMKEGERRLRERGIGIFCALIWETNIPSRMLFEREGYMEMREAVYYAKRDDPDI